jgi:hypothetical protein
MDIKPSVNTIRKTVRGIPQFHLVVVSVLGTNRETETALQRNIFNPYTSINGLQNISDSTPGNWVMNLTQYHNDKIESFTRVILNTHRVTMIFFLTFNSFIRNQNYSDSIS